MNEQILSPRHALNKAFLRVKPTRIEIDKFKLNLIILLDSINEQESEEHHKNLVSDFFKNTYYKPRYLINTKGNIDLVIHSGSNSSSPVGVIIEAKKPTNYSEMTSESSLNAKAFQELILYYMRERFSENNVEIKHLIVTNIYEWFVFDSAEFERHFAKNKELVRQFRDFEAGRLGGHRTDFFYREIAAPLIAKIEHEISYTHFDIRHYDVPLRNNNPKDDNKLVALYKLFSPEHLLKLPFANDSNSLDQGFYGELLHIMGLTETNSGGKKLIERKKEGNRHSASLLENAIVQVHSLGKIERLETPDDYGETYEERLFNVALELTITWINRILFLKLLEAQLVSYHKGDDSYKFLDIRIIKEYDDLNTLFFQVLAVEPEKRNSRVKEKFAKIPYLNSSLFEPADIEHITFFIGQLIDHDELPISSYSVLKDTNGRRRSGKLDALSYLFEFLNAYDFAGESGEEVQEENKTLINAAVLGLIFEKINGYADGSFFTPGFITMHICRKTIRMAVLQKFNEAAILLRGDEMPQSRLSNGDVFKSLEDVEDQIGPNGIFTRQQANDIVNSIKICDPAVGSGHFLVSALNEIIAVKNDLRILQDRNGMRLKYYHVEVQNDELIVIDENAELFEYNPKSRESQRVQEAFFHEKQTIIENCLFGVDININSVNICRLRLWIELLKNAYYKNTNQLETLPNIDINIKCGNSLISRFYMRDESYISLKQIRNKPVIDTYRLAVETYRSTRSKETKREMRRLIDSTKAGIEVELQKEDPLTKQLTIVQGKIIHMGQNQLFGFTKAELADWNKRLEKLTKQSQELEAKIEERKSGKIYRNAFEWRYEFPEVVSNDGEFIGFDVVLGNPPYVPLARMHELSETLNGGHFKAFTSTGDMYMLFYELGIDLLRNNGHLHFITSNKWMRAAYGKKLRNYFLSFTRVCELIDIGAGVFKEATVDSNLLMLQKAIPKEQHIIAKDISKVRDGEDLNLDAVQPVIITPTFDESWTISSPIERRIHKKINSAGKPLKHWNVKIYRGVLTGYNDAFIIDGKKRQELIAEDPSSEEIIKPLLRGRDVKRYKAEFADLWLINSHNGVKSMGIPRIKVKEDYPAIFNHLNQHRERLIKRQDKGDHWTNLRNCAYLYEFEKEKIIYPETTVGRSEFYVEKNKFIIDKTCFMIVGKHLYFFNGILSSKLMEWYLEDELRLLNKNSIQYSKQYIEKIPIPEVSEAKQQEIAALVEQVLRGKESGTATQHLEQQIDEFVYQMYGLTDEERAIVEAEFLEE